MGPIGKVFAFTGFPRIGFRICSSRLRMTGGKVEAARGERIEEEQGRQKDDNSSLTRIHRNNDEEEGNQLTMEI